MGGGLVVPLTDHVNSPHRASAEFESSGVDGAAVGTSNASARSRAAAYLRRGQAHCQETVQKSPARCGNGVAPGCSARKRLANAAHWPARRLVVAAFAVAALVLFSVPESFCASGATVPAPQRAALMDLWNGLGGLSTDFPDWGIGDPCVNGWTGVGCSSSTSAVVYVLYWEFPTVVHHPPVLVH